MSKVTESRYRQEIDEMLERGESTRAISRWLAQQDPPEQISHVAIARYARDRARVIRERLQEAIAEESIQRAVEGRRTAVEVIDALLERLEPVLTNGIRKALAASKGDGGLTIKETAMLGRLYIDLQRLRDEKVSGGEGQGQGVLTFDDAVRLLAAAEEGDAQGSGGDPA